MDGDTRTSFCMVLLEREREGPCACLDYPMLCAPAVVGGGEESPIRRAHPEQQGIVTVTRMDCSEKKRRISSSCIRELCVPQLVRWIF